MNSTDAVLHNLALSLVRGTELSSYRIEYTDADGETTQRVVTPLFFGISQKGDHRIYARCELREAIRVFHVDRIISMRKTRSVGYTTTEAMLALIHADRYVREDVLRAHERATYATGVWDA